MPEDTPLVVCFGEALIALVPTITGPLEGARAFERSLAGAECNTAVALTSAGTRAAVISRVGDDGFGRFVLHELAQHRVNTDAVEIDPEAPTGLYVKELAERDGGGVTSTMHYYRAGSAASRITPEALRTPQAKTLLVEAAVVHTSGITPALSPTARAAQDALFEERGDHLISFDLNWRPALWRGRLDEARITLGSYMARADIVQCSQEDAEALFGTADAAALRAAFPGPRHLVITRVDGSVAFDGQERADAPALEGAVVETIGAGDAFAAGFLAGLLSGLSLPGRLARAHRIASRAVGSTRDHVD